MEPAICILYCEEVWLCTFCHVPDVFYGIMFTTGLLLLGSSVFADRCMYW